MAGYFYWMMFSKRFTFIWRRTLGSLQLASSVIRLAGSWLAIVRSLAMRFRLRFNLSAAERQVSSGCAAMNSFTLSASRTQFSGGTGARDRNSGSGRSTEACKTP